jgi:hypothetical protein
VAGFREYIVEDILSGSFIHHLNNYEFLKEYLVHTTELHLYDVQGSDAWNQIYCVQTNYYSTNF